MVDSLLGDWRSGRLAERAGELQVDVVQVRRPGRDLGDGQALCLEHGQGLAGCVAVQGHGDASSDDKRVTIGDAVTSTNNLTVSGSGTGNLTFNG